MTTGLYQRFDPGKWMSAIQKIEEGATGDFEDVVDNQRPLEKWLEKEHYGAILFLCAECFKELKV